LRSGNVLADERQLGWLWNYPGEVAKVEPPVAPHSPDVPEAFPLAQLAGASRGAEFEGVAFDGDDIASRVAHDLRLERVRLKNINLDAVAARGLTIRDGVVSGGSWANLQAEGSTFARIAVTGVRATGANFADAALTDALFDGCRLDLALFRFATLNRVVLSDCRLDEADFYGATLASVRLERCSIRRASFDAATLSRCEIRSCDLTEIAGVERLAGASIGWEELIQIADLLADAHGIAVV
jgi:uncharacterized protein YjbI with pentapeptide repeats